MLAHSLQQSQLSFFLMPLRCSFATSFFFRLSPVVQRLPPLLKDIFVFDVPRLLMRLLEAFGFLLLLIDSHAATPATVEIFAANQTGTFTAVLYSIRELAFLLALRIAFCLGIVFAWH
jgi:hypothetical protein